jgi:spore germination protein
MERREPGMVLTAFQLGTMLLGVMLSLGPLFIGRIAVEATARDGWLAVCIASVLVLLNVWQLHGLAARFPNQTVTQYAEQLLGKVAGKLLASVLIALSILSCAVTLWYTGHLFNTYVLLLTPSYVIAFFLMALTAYLAYCDLRALGRVIVIIFFLSMPFNLFFVSPVASHGDWLNVMPMFENDWGTIAKGVLTVLFAFAGYEVLLTYFPYVKDKAKVFLHALWSVAFVCLMFILAALTQQLVYPLDYLEKVWVPSVQYVALSTLPILERTDMIFIMFWFVVLFKTNIMYFYRAVIEVGHLFHSKKKSLIVGVLAVMVFGISCVSVNVEQMERWFIWLFSTSVGLNFLLPPLLWVAYRLRDKRGAQR